MEVNLVFVYYRQETKEIKVLNLQDAKSQNDELITKGWSHTATLDPCKWIEYLFNETEPEDVIAGVKELSTNNMRTKVAV
jgi:hypothetical protein